MSKPIPDFENDPLLTARQKRRRREYYGNRDANIRQTGEWAEENPERVKANATRYRNKNRVKVRDYARTNGKRFRDRYADRLTIYRTSEEFKVSMRKHMLKKKTEVIIAYGGHCACCGENRIEFLCLDHIHNDGAERRRSGEDKAGSALYRELKKQGCPKGRFQVLCANCNSAKGYYGYCPHDIEAKALLGFPVNIVRISRPKAA